MLGSSPNSKQAFVCIIIFHSGKLPKRRRPELSLTSLPSVPPHGRQDGNDNDDEDDVVMEVPGTNAGEEEDESGTSHLKAGV